MKSNKDTEYELPAVFREQGNHLKLAAKLGNYARSWPKAVAKLRKPFLFFYMCLPEQ